MVRVIVSVARQEAEVWNGPTLQRVFRVSTAAKGVSCEEGSLCTPTGLLRVAEKIGEGSPYGTVFRARKATGELWRGEPTGDDLVLTRVLWLEGCEPRNANTRERYIYFHGTNQEHLLGTPASHGCIRLSNDDIVELYDLVPLGTPVEIV